MKGNEVFYNEAQVRRGPGPPAAAARRCSAARGGAGRRAARAPPRREGGGPAAGAAPLAPRPPLCARKRATAAAPRAWRAPRRAARSGAAACSAALCSAAASPCERPRAAPPPRVTAPRPLPPNPGQVTNRDLSIAVLRSFLPLRASEIASGALRRNKSKGLRTPRPASSGADGAAAAPAAGDAAAAAAAAAAPAAPAGAPGPDSSEVTAAAAAAAAPAADSFGGGGARILEGLAASGLRSIRYALELDGVDRVDANDLDPSVVETMRSNIAFNGGAAADKVHACNEDARLLMLKSHQVGRLQGRAEGGAAGRACVEGTEGTSRRRARPGARALDES
jgi:hypothetical protein